MKEYILVLVVLIISSIVYFKLAVKYKIIDKPNHRSSHTSPTIRGGGILFFIALLIFFLINHYTYPYFFLGLILLGITSFIDDLKDLSSKLRFSIQIIALLLLLYQVAIPISPIWYSLLILFFGLVSLNIFNFMDGINGITGFYGLSSIFGLYIINCKEGIFNPDIFIFIVLAIIIFGFFNFRKKALMFAGDIGSITIGYFIIFITTKMVIVLDAPLMILVFGVYGIDSGGTIIYRKFFTNENWTAAHRHHIYQKLVDLKGLSHLRVSIYYALLQILFCIFLFFIYDLPAKDQWFISIPIVVVVSIVYILLFRWLKK